MHRFLAAMLAWLLLAAAPLVAHAQELQAGGIMGNPLPSRAPATDATLQALINQTPSPLTIPSPSFTGTLGGSVAFSGNLTFNGTLTAPNLAVPGSITGSVCVDASGHLLNDAGANCFGGGGGGSGTVNSGTINQLAFYAATGTAVSGLATANNGVLITSGAGVPSIGSTLPAAVQANITGLGTVTTGVWNGTAIGLGFGGLGGSQSAATVNQFPVFPGGGGAAVPTSFATFLGNVCSSVIGQYWVQLSGGWGCTSLGWANPVWWGADPTGAADSTAAFNSAQAASANVKAPCGTFKIASALAFTFPATVPFEQSLTGGGSGCTTLSFSNNNGMSYSMSSERHSVRLGHLRIANTAANTGTGLSISNSQCLGATLFSMSTFYDLLIDGDDNATHYWATAVDLNTVSGDTWYADTISGRRNSVTDTTGGGIGINYHGPSTCTISGHVFQGSNIYHYISQSTLNQLSAAVKAGTGTQGVFLQEVDIQNGDVGVCVPGTSSDSCNGSATTNTNEIGIFNSQIAVNSPIEILSPAAALTAIGNVLVTSGGAPNVDVKGSTVSFVTGNFLTCGTTGGIGFYTNFSNGAITGNLITGCGTGAWFDTGAQFNAFTGNSVVGATNAVFVAGSRNGITGNNLNGSSSAVDLVSGSSQNRVFANNVNSGGNVDAGTSNKVGQTCSPGTPSSSFATEQGVVIHC